MRFLLEVGMKKKPSKTDVLRRSTVRTTENEVIFILQFKSLNGERLVWTDANSKRDTTVIQYSPT